jgi:hypothetical protein
LQSQSNEPQLLKLINGLPVISRCPRFNPPSNLIDDLTAAAVEHALAADAPT